ncbi:ABC transporter substrate-binding protein [Burkholderia stabilis]|uniref:ABC transporter substrate-binding protein n=1 Tax=Burkholderia stabilis TaxID=95485 RepID=UPI00158BF188|nr:ABC transporter substrate-binding protein [Burkholderia stabilis]
MSFSRIAGKLFVICVASIASFSFAVTLDLSSQQPTRPRAAPVADAIHAIPSNTRFVDKKALTVGIVASMLPLSAYANDVKTVVGFDPDIARLLADSLGRRLDIVAIAWPDWPLALESGRVDAVISNVTVTEQRKEKFDFSTYRQDVLGFYVKNGSRIKAINAPADIAGLRIVSDSGTNQEKILLEWDKENVAHGLRPIQVQYYDDEAVRAVALQSGRADALFSVNAVFAYQAAQQKNIHLVGIVNGGWPRAAEIAVATRKGSGLAEPLTVAINAAIKDGQYAKVLTRWNLGAEAIERAATNPPGLPKM